MLILRRWWVRHGFQLLVAALLLAGAWGIRQSKGGIILEIYAFLARPFVSDSPDFPAAQLTDRRLQELEGRLQELERQNQQLKSLLGYLNRQPTPALPAPIIGRSPDEWWQQIILGRGSRDGIATDDAVTGTGGLVGRVIEVTPQTSRVLLISDPNSSVGATISRSRSMGYIKGQGSPIAIMQFFEKVPDVRPGDVVTTSTLSRLFPGGLPIGRVQSVNLESGPLPEAKIVFTAPIPHLEWVAVHRSASHGP
jgi:rod shape-determining protein MreC